MKCSGHDIVTGERIEVEFDSVISHVDPVLEDGDENIFVAPGFIDLQVNGFAGADYNSPETPHDELIRSIRTMVSTGVTVKRFRYIDRIVTNRKALLQVSSEICGDLPSDWASRLGDILFTLLPAGSVTGAPKEKTVEIIRDTENYQRGFYTGICGYFDGKTLDSGVMIRFIENDGGTFAFKSRGGITALSDVKSEYEEMIQKVYVPVI